jgi:hypothetical protein
MSEKGTIIIEPIEKKDLTELKELAHANGGSRQFTESYIEHLYYKNPFHSFSFWKATTDGKIEGYATTNNFQFNSDGKLSWVAMPQNVLTSQKLRGKGVFQLLYQKTETDNLENKNADYFLTFTNALSTPIFLNKFGYLRGKCPNLLVFIWNPAHLLSGIQYKRVDSLEALQPEDICCLNNALLKSKAYYLWRYEKYQSESLHLLNVKKNNLVIGHAVLVANKKKGVKFLMLTDVICKNSDDVKYIVDACKKYAARQFYPFMIMFDIEGLLQQSLTQITIKNRFNFLVKGKTPEETMMLSKKSFQLFLGDTDFV